MLALRLVRLIETHSDEIAQNLVHKIRVSSHTRELQELSEQELLAGMHGLLGHFSEWLLTKAEADVERRWQALGTRLARERVPMAQCCWAVNMTKECLWDFLQRQAFVPSPVELYGEMELLRLLNPFFDRAVYYLIEGYEREREAREVVAKASKKRRGEFKPAAFVL
jgi:hypothetical protein